MCLPPQPAFPAVGLTRLQRVAAAQIEQIRLCTMGSMNDLRLTMSVGLAKNRKRSVGVMDALDLIGDYLSCLVPTYTDILGLTSVLRIALTLWIPIDALHRMQNAILRIDSLLVADGQRRDHRLLARLKDFASRFDSPWLALIHACHVIVMQRSNTQDLVIFHINARRVGTACESRPRDPTKYCIAPRFLSGLHGLFLSLGDLRTNASTRRT